MVNKPSVFKSLRFYCYKQMDIHMHVSRNRFSFLEVKKACHRTTYCNIYTTAAQDKVLFFPTKITFFLISQQKHMLWFSLEAPCRGTSNEYPQHMFSWKNKKNIMWIPYFIWCYVLPIILILSLISIFAVCLFHTRTFQKV